MNCVSFPSARCLPEKSFAGCASVCPADNQRGIIQGNAFATVDGTGKIVPYTAHVNAPAYVVGDNNTLLHNNTTIAKAKNTNTDPVCLLRVIAPSIDLLIDLLLIRIRFLASVLIWIHINAEGTTL